MGMEHLGGGFSQSYIYKSCSNFMIYVCGVSAENEKELEIYTFGDEMNAHEAYQPWEQFERNYNWSGNGKLCVHLASVC